MTEKGPHDLQGRVMNKIKSTLPANISLADELADLLKISTDSAYRRIRGETPLTIDEIQSICTRFKLSFDSLLTLQEFTVNFEYNEVSNRSDFMRYLLEIKDELSRILKAPEKHIIYAAVDVPIFHYFKFPEYFYFKMFYWLRSVSDDPGFQQKQFRVSDLEDEIIQVCRQIADLYAMVPSTEIWSDSLLGSIIKQIHYYWNSGIFGSKEDVLSLIDAVRKTLELVQRESELNMKLKTSGESDDMKKNFHLYHSDIEIGNNFILVRIGTEKMLYNSFHTFNKMFTTNRVFCDLSEKWMDNLIKQSNLISGVGEKYRFQFFRKMYGQLDDLIRLIV